MVVGCFHHQLKIFKVFLIFLMLMNAYHSVNADSKDESPSSTTAINEQETKASASSFVPRYEVEEESSQLESGETTGIDYSNTSPKHIETGSKSTPSSVEDVVQIPKYNRSYVSSTTRRPLGGVLGPTRSSVVQSIPKRPKIQATINERSREFGRETVTNTANPRGDGTTTIVYATSVPSSRPYINIRSTPLPGSNNRYNEQISRPAKNTVSILPRTASSTAKPFVEENLEQDSEKRVTQRRQLNSNAGDSLESRQQLAYSQASTDSDSSDIYGTVGSTARPLFTTTGSSHPRVPSVLIAARQKASQLRSQLAASSKGPNEKYYIKTRFNAEESESNEPKTESNAVQYVTQSPVPVQIEANKNYPNILQQAAKEPTTATAVVEYNTDPRVRNYKPSSQATDSPQHYRIPLFDQRRRAKHEQEQFLRETTPSTLAQTQNDPQLQYRNRDENYGKMSAAVAPTQPLPFYSNYQEENYNPYQVPVYPYAQQQLPPGRIPYSPHYYRSSSERPLTARDFERLLQLLVYRHSQVQRMYGLGNQYPYQEQYSPYPVSLYQPQYHQPYVPSPAAVPPYVRPTLELPPRGENTYEAQNIVPRSQLPMNYELRRLVPRTRPSELYQQVPPRTLTSQNDDYSDDGSETNTNPNLIPADVREELLYRMLMLALASPAGRFANQQQNLMQQPAPVNYHHEEENRSPLSNIKSFRKPVRSVQILGEE